MNLNYINHVISNINKNTFLNSAFINNVFCKDMTFKKIYGKQRNLLSIFNDVYISRFQLFNIFNFFKKTLLLVYFIFLIRLILN